MCADAALGLDAGPSDRWARGPVRDVVLAYLMDETAHLRAEETAVSDGTKVSVHQLRVAARRLRSTLTTYRPLFRPGAVDGIRDELRWLGRVLAPARDAEVLLTRLDLLCTSERASVQPVLTRWASEVEARHAEALERARSALGSERFEALTESLAQLAAPDGWVVRAEARAEDELPSLLRRSAKAVERAVEDIEHASSATMDVALHEARKKVKRYTYAAESAQPVFGHRAERLANRSKQVQSALGEHQDSVTARAALTEWADQDPSAADDAEVVAMLRGIEQDRGQVTEAEFARAWKQLPRGHLRRWLAK